MRKILKEEAGEVNPVEDVAETEMEKSGCAVENHEIGEDAEEEIYM